MMLLFLLRSPAHTLDQLGKLNIAPWCMHVWLNIIRTSIGSPAAFVLRPHWVDTRARLITTSMEQSGTEIPNSQLASMQQDTADSPRPLRDHCAPRPVGSSLNGFYGNGMPPGDALSEMAESRTSEDDISTDDPTN